jgi:DNA polymerase elongation subunit (family B)
MTNLEFQIYDWREDHEFIKPESDVESDDEDANTQAQYIIRVFGKTMDGKSVFMKMKDFTPYFFIELPEEWDKKKAKGNLKKMFEFLKSDKNTKIFPKKYKEGLIDLQLVEKKKPKGFTNNKIFYFGLLVFDNDISRKKFANLFDPVSYDKTKKVNNKLTIFSISPNPINYPVYEANFPAMLRCFHIQNITGCGWVSVENVDLIEDKQSYCDYEFEINWKKVKPIQKDVNAPLVIASFDIECYSSDDQFPQAKRKSDKIIQIGTTYTKLGESVPFRQHIVCLKETDKLDNIIVESYKKETDLIKGWIEEIRKSDCDIITGYNIFYFDEKYIYDRCKEILYMDDEDMNISKLKNYSSNFKEMTLASSALGENLLRFWETPGRVHIDLMKDVQNTFKLNSYKLDNVAANFIRGEIKNIELITQSVSQSVSQKKDNVNKYKLTCDKLNDLFDDDFIHIELMKSFVSDYVGKKYQIYQLDKINNCIYIETNLDILKEIEILGKGKLYWSQAKDDVGPKDIFRLQKGSSYDRSIVAKYCVKDCRLVNLLMNKLEIVTKSIEMSNVSYVPLYFLFTRGQGIKLFSLCMKFYRDEGFAFPVIRKPIEDQDKYEGAIVFDPIPSAIYEALSVKDYASLYPSSILHKNMSHETKIIDERYDNLPGVVYYNAYFRESNGKFEYRRFAKVDNQYGVIPKILDFLLKERKRVKKLMKTETDPFKLAILEAKQLAFKLTANSLYGQLGAGTSPVRDRDIAACTTSTGREMLIFAKKYDEEILPWIINGLKYAKINNDDLTREYLLKKEMKNYEDNELKVKIDNLVDIFIKENITIQPIIKYGDTDSVFCCHRYRDNIEKVDNNTSLYLWKEILEFGRELIKPFISDYQDLWVELYNKYYDLDNIVDLVIPQNYKVKEKPNHWKIRLPIEDSLLLFMKEYVEESYLPWLWTLQDLFLKEYNDLDYLDKKTYDSVLEIKIFKRGEMLMEKINLVPDDFDSETKMEIINNIKNFIDYKLKDYWIQPYIVYNNNNNIIKKVKFYKGGNKITDKRCMEWAIDLGVISGDLVKSRLPPPHDLEYEKTFWPYIILTKKRYVGNKYEFNKNKYKMDFMGIVLKRRDNAPIVKEVCEGIITRLLNDKDPIKAKEFTEKCLDDMINSKYDIKYFLTSKTLKLKESYADWTKIAHVVLAERIGKRDPGNKPQSGDRIEYAAVCIDNETKETLQGDKIETPLYIKENNLDLDYLFYIRNQIMNPAIQFLELAVKNPTDIFNKVIVKLENKKSGQIDINIFLKKKSSRSSAKNTKSITDSSDSEKPVRKSRKKKDKLEG